MDKAELRRLVRERVKGMGREAQETASRDACDRLRKQRVWQEAESVLFYAPLATELDIWSLLGEALTLKKVVALPRFSKETGGYVACQVQNPLQDIAAGPFGIREPVGSCRELPLKLDLILVPGVAFDCHGRRLGRGKGYYDRLLAAVDGTTCGVAFDEQVVSEVPVEPHDVLLSCILTPTRWLQR